MDIKIVYFVTTSGQKWGKGLTLIGAMEAAGINQLKRSKKQIPKAVIYFALFKAETTADELENLRQCITADATFGGPKFYENKNEPTYKADMEMIDRLFLGWANDIESFT